MTDHIRLELSPLAVDSSAQRTAKEPVPIGPAMVEVIQKKDTSDATGPASAIEGRGPDLEIVNQSADARPRSQRMNSIYTYLTRPARFSWPVTPASNMNGAPLTKDDAKEVGSDRNDQAAPIEAEVPSPSPIVISTKRTMSPTIIMALLATAVLFFLLGSLIRSLLGEHQDYYTVLPVGAISTEPEWQEMTRILEVKVWRWHLMVASLRGRTT